MLASSVLLVGYCWVLIDWYNDMKLGRYEREPFNTVIEIGIILSYCYLAYRFIQSKTAKAQPLNPGTPGKSEDYKTRSLRHSYSLLRKMTNSVSTTKSETGSAGWPLTRSQRFK
ncbi:hypothetical protein GCM10028810_57080 [Spirosoma litoris]